MPLKRLMLLIAFALLIYLGVYTWNKRTHVLNDITTNIGLEASGFVIKSLLFVQNSITETWNKYIDLVHVREENESLKNTLSKLKTQLYITTEEQSELIRLRKLLSISTPKGLEHFGAKILANKIGSNAALATVIIDCGYLTGATPGTPAMAYEGLVGRVFRSGPTTATVLLLIDPGSRISVVSQTSRVQGILVGTGSSSTLEVLFVSQNAQISPGETLITSGLDEAFPKGIPVAKVLTVTESDLSPFKSIDAAPLVNIANLEELLLVKPAQDSSHKTPTKKLCGELYEAP